MKKSIKNKWIKALRSGKYAQVSGALKEALLDKETGDIICDAKGQTKYGYCCLGVLAEISGAGDRQDMKDGCFFGGPDKDGEYDFMDELQTRQLLGEPLPKGLVNKLAQFNDGSRDDNSDAKPWSFKKIASWIERSKSF